MKCFLTTMMAVMMGLSLHAQDNPDADARQARSGEGRERIKAARAAYLTQRMELTSAEAEKFWPIYREFAEKREAIIMRMRDERKAGKDDESMIKAFHKARQEQLDLEKSYAPRFLQVIPAGKLMKMNEAERDFNSLVRRQIGKGHRDPGMKQRQMRERRNR